MPLRFLEAFHQESKRHTVKILRTELDTVLLRFTVLPQGFIDTL